MNRLIKNMKRESIDLQELSHMVSGEYPCYKNNEPDHSTAQSKLDRVSKNYLSKLAKQMNLLTITIDHLHFHCYYKLVIIDEVRFQKQRYLILYHFLSIVFILCSHTYEKKSEFLEIPREMYQDRYYDQKQLQKALSLSVFECYCFHGDNKQYGFSWTRYTIFINI